MQITDEQKQSIKEILERLCLTQADLARENGISPSTLSEFLKLDSNKGITKEKWRSILDYLAFKIENDEKALVERSQFYSAQKLVSTLIKSSTIVKSHIIQSPGGPLRSDALNYIIRDPDTELEEALLQGFYTPSSFIIGGVQYGKSSLLNRLTAQVQKAKYIVKQIDFKELIWPSSSWSTHKLFIKIFQALGLEIEQKDFFEKDDEEALDWAIRLFTNWSKKEFSGKRVFLLIDSVDSLREHLTNEDEGLLFLFSWLAQIRTRMADRESPFSKLSMVTVCSANSWAPAKGSPLGAQSDEKEIPAFSKQDIAELLKILSIRPNSIDSISDNLYELFHGHPHLTHVAAFDLKATGEGLDNVEQNALLLHGAYGSHWRRIKSELTATISKDEETIRDLLEAIRSVANDKSKPSEDELAVFAQAKVFLRLLGIISDNENGKIRISRFYLNAIDRTLQYEVPFEEKKLAVVRNEYA